MPEITVNGVKRPLDVEPEMPLLWVLRDELGLTGTKFGCGIANCGACTVEIDGVATRSCVMPLSAVEGKSVRTIEAEPDALVKQLQAAWIAHQVPQCGYCQSGMILAAAGLLRRVPKPTDAQIDENITNICRCGTYQRIRAAIHTAAAAAQGAAA
jgi:isoquinoline 1-oxidoreductase alpha subunit